MWFKKAKSHIPTLDEIKARKKEFEAAKIRYEAVLKQTTNDILTDEDVKQARTSALTAFQSARRALTKSIPTAKDMKHRVADSLVNVAKKLEGETS